VYSENWTILQSNTEPKEMLVARNKADYSISSMWVVYQDRHMDSLMQMVVMSQTTYCSFEHKDVMSVIDHVTVIRGIRLLPTTSVVTCPRWRMNVKQIEIP